MLENYPRLTTYGMGIFERIPRYTYEERMSEYESGRETLRNSTEHIAVICNWLLDNISKTKVPPRYGAGSYRVKHIVERATGSYVYNGELIAAAILAGYPMCEYPGPNPEFGMSKRDLDAAAARWGET